MSKNEVCNIIIDMDPLISPCRNQFYMTDDTYQTTLIITETRNCIEEIIRIQNAIATVMRFKQSA
jgi:hypothetical protein